MYAKWQDGLNFLSKLNRKRAVNLFRLYVSYYLSKYSKRPKHKGMPVSLSLEPTTSCNLRCPECPSGLRSFTRPTGRLNKSLFKKVIDETEETLLYLLFYFQGEPYLHPDFFDLVKYAASKKIYTATSTNGHFLKDDMAQKTVTSGLDRLIISIDGTTQETYQAYRVGGRLSTVLEGTENVIRWKKKLRSKTPYVIFQFLVVKPNEHQIREVKELAKTLGVDAVSLKTAQIYDYEKGSDLIPTIARYSRYKKESDGSYSIKNKMLNHCWKMWHASVITWDGQVVPCCFDKDAQHALGNVSTQTFKSIWLGNAYQNFRKNLFKARSEIDICRNCTEGMRVEVFPQV